MSRETKIGIVVAVSFLCLVGVVVATKWRGRGDGNDLAQNVGAKDKGNANENGSNPPQKNGLINAGHITGDNSPVNPPANNDANPSLPVAIPMNDPTLAPLPAPPAVPMVNSPLPMAPQSSDEETRRALLAQIEQDKLNKGQVPPPPLPLPGNVFNKPNEPPLSPPAAVSDNKNNIFAQGNEQPLPPVNKGSDDIFNKLPPKVDDIAAKQNDTINKAAQGASDKFDALLNKGNDAVNKGFDNVNKGIDDANKNLPPAPFAANPMVPPAPSPAPMSNTNNNPFARTDSVPPPVPAPSNNNNNNNNNNNTNNNPVARTDSVPPPVPAPSNNNNTNNNPFVRTDSVPPPVPTPMPMNQNLPPITNSNNNNNNSNPFAKAETPLPVIPAPMNQNLPPITNSNNNNNNNSGFVIPAPGKTSEVKVTNYDTQSFVARPGDSFASLSKAAYESEAYGNALLAFNRDYNRDFHPNATALQPGQKVMLPSRQFLQDRYSAALANNRPGMTQNGGITINAPVPVIPKSNVPVPPTSDVTKSYRVPGAGQPIYELAIQTLGDGGRWTEIYRLNPNLDPLQPIPGGTVVRLPVNARAP